MKRSPIAKKQADLLRALPRLNGEQRVALLRKTDQKTIRCICECALNILLGNVPLSTQEKNRLRRYVSVLRRLAEKRKGNKKENYRSARFRRFFTGTALTHHQYRTWTATMKHARKMILVPFDSTCRPACHPTVQTPGNPISRLDEEMSQILNSRDFTDDKEKWTMYSQTLQRYLHAVNPPAGGPQSETERVEEVRINDQMILDSVPQTFKKRAKSFLEFLKQVKSLSWDENGVPSVYGRPAIGSNVIDIVNDAVRRRRNFAAAGRGLISKTLIRAGMPRTFVGNEDFWSEGLEVADNTVQEMSFANEHTWRDMTGISTIKTSTSSTSPGASVESGGSSSPLYRPVNRSHHTSLKKGCQTYPGVTPLARDSETSLTILSSRREDINSSKHRRNKRHGANIHFERRGEVQRAR